LNANDIQAWAAPIQAFAAVVTLLLTVFLIWFTSRTARSAERQAEAASKQVAAAQQQIDTAQQQLGLAQRQLAESIRAREAAVQPYIHVLGVGFQRGQDRPDLVTLAPDVNVLNVGPGPALSVMLAFRHDHLVVPPMPGPRVLPSGAERPPLPAGAVTEARSDRIAPEAELWIEYRDMLGHWWATEMPLRLDLDVDTEGPRPWRHSLRQILCLDHGERVYRIDKPRIREDFSGVDV